MLSQLKALQECSTMTVLAPVEAKKELLSSMTVPPWPFCYLVASDMVIPFKLIWMML